MSLYASNVSLSRVIIKVTMRVLHIRFSHTQKRDNIISHHFGMAHNPPHTHPTTQATAPGCAESTQLLYHYYIGTAGYYRTHVYRYIIICYYYFILYTARVVLLLPFIRPTHTRPFDAIL